MNDARQQIISQTCKGHTTKFADREFGRTCPSRLSKRELEDLYFALLDNNLELKQTINGQNEKIKQLSTRVQRLSAVQKTSFNRSEKECCSSGKALIREQKEVIADQKKANERLSERVRILNMRLCSAKQFLGRNSARCNKCCLGMNISLKNSTISALNSANKRSLSNLQTTVASNDIIHKESQTRSIEVQTEYGDTDNGAMSCDENKCKTLMDELKRKIVALEEELSKAHEEHSKRVSRLEREVLTLRQSNGENHFTVQQSEVEIEQLMQRLRAAEMRCDDINLQLSVERRKVSALETGLKAADLSAQVAKTVERHLRTQNLAKLSADCEVTPRSDEISSVEHPTRTKITQEPKNSDDSGYMEATLLDDKKSPAKDVNIELREKISDLQSQINSLKRLAAVERDSEKKFSNFEPYELAVEDDEVSILRSINDYSNLMKASPIVVESSRNKPGDVFVLERPESIMLQAKGQDFDTKVSQMKDTRRVPETDTSNISNLTYRTNVSGSVKGVLDKPEISQRPQRKDEKMVKNVSYDDVNLNYQKNFPKTTSNKVDDDNLACYTSLAHASSSEKHNVKIDELSATSNVIENISTMRRKQDENVKLSKNDQDRESYDYIAGKKLDYDRVSTEEEDYNATRPNFDKNYPMEDTKRSSKKEQVAKGGKKISLDIPEPDMALYSRETKKAFRTPSAPEKLLSIEIIKSESSYDRAPKSPTVTPFSHNIEETVEMKVLKEVRPSSEIDLPKDETANLNQKKTVATNGLMAQTNGQGGIIRDAKKVGSQTPQRRSSSGGGTYLVGGASPRDTDGEISGLTDLPDERDEASERIFSPGEERPTYTETCTSTTDITLSEGELPVSYGGKKPLSPGERKWKNSSGEISPVRTTSQRMEEALQAVGEELARCRHMLQRQRPQQTKSSKEISLMTESVSDSIVLGKAEGRARIMPEHEHSCRFTFHVGTVVLSDQAVTYSRGKSLLLAWHFYDQQQAMVRMSSGRIHHFDFTTEYRLPITENFLGYMKKKEMPLKICNLEKPEEVLASCSLPLRGALKHVNRRVYLSLALVASPEMLIVDFDALDSGDEVGVLDVWCRLKVGPALLSAIQKALNQSPDVTAPLMTNEQPGVSHLKHGSTAQRMVEEQRLIEEKTVTSSAEDLRRAVAKEIRSSSKLRALLRDFSDSNSIYNIIRGRKRRVNYYNDLGPKLSNGQKKSVKIEPERNQLQLLEAQQRKRQTLDITIMWFALNEECKAMARADVQRLYVAYSFLGRDGADLETPVSLPKPKDCTEKCYFNFKKTFQLDECDLPLLGQLAKCKRRGTSQPSHRDCLTFTLISEPPEDSLGLDICEDIGYAQLYLGDVLSRCDGSDSYTDVLSVRGAHSNSACGVLAVRVAGLHALKNLCSVIVLARPAADAQSPRAGTHDTRTGAFRNRTHSTTPVLTPTCVRKHNHASSPHAPALPV